MSATVKYRIKSREKIKYQIEISIKKIIILRNVKELRWERCYE